MVLGEVRQDPIQADHLVLSEETVTSEIITIGDEILRGEVVNSNAAIIGAALSQVGMPPRHVQVIADSRDEIKLGLGLATSRSSVAILTGGLGPTPDDLTLDAVAEYFGLDVLEDKELLRHVESFFETRGIKMSDTSRNQARFPVGADKIPNSIGTATGIQVARKGRYVFVLPGVQAEMKLMLSETVIPRIRAAFPEARVITKTLRLADIGESQLLKKLGDVSELHSVTGIAFLPHHGLLDLRITAKSKDNNEALMQIATTEQRIRDMAEAHIYSVGDTPIAEVIGNVLVNRGQRLAIAESCTGGLLMQRLTEIAGASRWFERGWVTYSNDAKSIEVGVNPASVSEHGAVSEIVARELAEGARKKAKANWSVSITGIAGPDGGTSEKPVGTVWIAVSSNSGTSTRRYQLGGGRELIRLRAVHSAMYMLWRALMDSPPDMAAYPNGE